MRKDNIKRRLRLHVPLVILGTIVMVVGFILRKQNHEGDLSLRDTGFIWFFAGLFGDLHFVSFPKKKKPELEFVTLVAIVRAIYLFVVIAIYSHETTTYRFDVWFVIVALGAYIIGAVPMWIVVLSPLLICVGLVLLGGWILGLVECGNGYAGVIPLSFDSADRTSSDGQGVDSSSTMHVSPSTA